MMHSNTKIALFSTLAILAMSCTSSKKGTDSDTTNTDVTETKGTDNTKCPNLKTGKLVNMTNLDGCGWMIELTNGTKLDPINLASFKLELVNGKKVSVSYLEKNNMPGICMAGTIVEINCIIEVNTK